jgi:NMT1-like family
VAILRQNVMALVVPTQPPPAASAKKEAGAPATKEASTGEKKAAATKPEAIAGKAKAAKNDKSAKDSKNAKSAEKDADKGAEKIAAKNADKSDDADGKTAGKDDSSSDADANDSNKLDKVTKLAGRRIGVVTGNEATQDLLDVVLNHYGVPLGQVQASLIDPKNIADAVKAQQIDALFVAGSATGQAINDVVAAATLNGQAPTFIAIDQAEGIAKRRPAFDAADIDAGVFGGNPPAPGDDLKSLSFAEYLVAKKSVQHDAVAAVAKLIYTSRLALAAAMPGDIKIQAPPTDKDARVVVHPGALAYLTDDQKTFFDKYGDDIFYGLLIFPIFGSAIAGVAGYFRSGGRTRRLRLLQRVLDLVRKAHTAPSLEALDQMQADVEHLVVAIIHRAEHEEYDQTMQMSFSLALDQARFAIDSRRAILLEQSGSGAKPGAQAAAA